MNIPLSLGLDILIAILLFTAIIYCAILNKRLGQLRSDRKELHSLVNDLNLAAQNAQSTIELLKTGGEAAGRRLRGEIKTARIIGDDLERKIGGARQASTLSAIKRSEETEESATVGLVQEPQGGRSSVEQEQNELPDNRKAAFGREFFKALSNGN